MQTPFGETSAALVRGTLAGTEILFLPRHGASHQLPPHRINYRANLWALRESGAQGVVGLAAVGGITEGFGPRVLAVPDQIIDYTYGRLHTIHEGGESGVEHVDMTEPYCSSLRQELLRAGGSAGVPLVAGGTYAATQGPRLETTAEVARLERDGCDVVGMTGMPEAGIARELGLCYASLAFVVNWAAGKGEAKTITMQEIEQNLESCIGEVCSVLSALVAGA